MISNSPEKVIDVLARGGMMLSVAESCTGGHISDIITDVPGASRCFAGGLVVYSNDLKGSILGIEDKTLMDHGAVSSETAVEMSKASLAVTGSDISLAVTGIAGPDGGTDEKPVGTVFISVHSATGEKAVKEYHLEGLERREFKEEVARRALKMLLDIL